MAGLDFPAAVDEINATAAFLKKTGSPRVGVLGFCMGGALALGALAKSDFLACGTSFYGVNRGLFEAASEGATNRGALEGGEEPNLPKNIFNGDRTSQWKPNASLRGGRHWGYKHSWWPRCLQPFLLGLSRSSDCGRASTGKPSSSSACRGSRPWLAPRPLFFHSILAAGRGGLLITQRRCA